MDWIQKLKVLGIIQIEICDYDFTYTEMFGITKPKFSAPNSSFGIID